MNYFNCVFFGDVSNPFLHHIQQNYKNYKDGPYLKLWSLQGSISIKNWFWFSGPKHAGGLCRGGSDSEGAIEIVANRGCITK